MYTSTCVHRQRLLCLSYKKAHFFESRCQTTAASFGVSTKEIFAFNLPQVVCRIHLFWLWEQYSFCHLSAPGGCFQVLAACCPFIGLLTCPVFLALGMRNGLAIF